MINEDDFIKLVAKTRKEHPDDFECEWCGMTYPSDSHDKSKPLGYSYYIIKVRNIRELTDFKTHIICKDCYNKLERI